VSLEFVRAALKRHERRDDVDVPASAIGPDVESRSGRSRNRDCPLMGPSGLRCGPMISSDQEHRRSARAERRPPGMTQRNREPEVRASANQTQGADTKRHLPAISRSVSDHRVPWRVRRALRCTADSRSISESVDPTESRREGGHGESIKGRPGADDEAGSHSLTEDRAT
jgi:hypothetical protein